MSPVADHDPRRAGTGFAAALRARRLARGLTQDELAARAHLGVRTLRELERGRVARPQRNTVALLADALELTGAEREAFLNAAAGRPLPPPPPLPRLPAPTEVAGRFSTRATPAAPPNAGAHTTAVQAGPAHRPHAAERIAERPATAHARPRLEPRTNPKPGNQPEPAPHPPAHTTTQAGTTAPATTQAGTTAPASATAQAGTTTPATTQAGTIHPAAATHPTTQAGTIHPAAATHPTAQAGTTHPAAATHPTTTTQAGATTHPGTTTHPTAATHPGTTTQAGATTEAARRPRTEGDRPPTDVPPTTLPLPTLPTLVGRDADIAELLALLGPAEPTRPAPWREVVREPIALIGMAGVGKTALAHAVAHAASAAGWTAVSVTVTNISQPTDIFSAVAAVFGVARADDLADRYTMRRPGRPALLVLDGADRSPRAAIDAIGWLRARLPALRVLITSRRPLAGELPGALDWQVQPLEVPAEGLDVAAMRAVAAVALFVERLRLVRREPARDDEIAPIAELVRRLDGLPLAIELAAARGRVLQLPELLSRYANRVLDLAPTDPAGRRLRDAVAASYQLLSERDQAALRRLSTLRGRWSVELAEALLDGVVEDVEAVLDRLVGLGLVSVRGPGDLRFRLLDVVLDFAAERCADAGELRAARLRHAEVVARVAMRASAELTGPNSAAAVSRLDYLNSDIRTALRYAAVREPETALRLAGAIPRWCRLRGRDVEAHQLLRRLLDDRRTRGCDPAVRAWAQVGAAMLATAHGDGLSELCATEAALVVLVERGDVTGELTARALLAGIWQALGGTAAARRHSEAMLGLAIRTGRVREIAVAQNNLAWHDVLAGDLGTAARRLTAAGRRAAEAGDARVRALADANLAEVARLDGRFDEAVELARRAVIAIAEVGDPIHRVRALGTLGQAFAETRRPAEARAVQAELAAATGSAGTAAMIEGYLALARDDRPAAAAAFESAANLLAGRDDVRDVLEALTGLAASAAPARRERALEELAGLCGRGRLALLPREHRLLAGVRGTDEGPLAARDACPPDSARAGGRR